MPNLEEHCKRALKRYGVEGRDIHEWLDKPSRKYAGAHRQFRHDSETIRLVGEIFGKKYGKSLAENIALDHITLDHEEEIKKRRTIVVKFPEKKEIPSIPCSYCNTLLKPSDQFCPNCGASRTKIIEEFDRAYEMEKIKLQEKRKKLRKELKRELHFKEELTPKQRINLWKITSKNAWDYPILTKLVQEDFEKYPKLKKQFETERKIESALRLIGVIFLSFWLIIPAIYIGIMFSVLGGFIWFLFWGAVFFVALTTFPKAA